MYAHAHTHECMHECIRTNAVDCGTQYYIITRPNKESYANKITTDSANTRRSLWAKQNHLAAITITRCDNEPCCLATVTNIAGVWARGHCVFLQCLSNKECSIVACNAIGSYAYCVGCTVGWNGGSVSGALWGGMEPTVIEVCTVPSVQEII